MSTLRRLLIRELIKQAVLDGLEPNVDGFGNKVQRYRQRVLAKRRFMADMEKERILRNYLRHFRANVRVALKSFALGLFHLAHAIVPVEFTSHHYWGW